MRRLAPAVTVALAAWIGIFGSQTASAKITISPAFAEMRLDKGRATGEFSISNDGDAEERFRINTQHFIFTRDGSIQKVPPDEHSMAPWIIFNPKEFTVPPKSRQAVRWAVLPRGELRNGEYWCCMELESLNTSTATSTDEKGRKMKIEIVGVVLVPMFGLVGKVDYQGSLKQAGVQAQADGSSIVEAIFLNGGNGRLLPYGKYEIADSSGAVVAKGEGGRLYGYVMPGNERLFTSTLTAPLPAGKYTLRIEFTSPNLADPLKQEVSFDWVPPPPKAPKTTGAAASPSTMPAPGVPSPATPPPGTALPGTPPAAGR
jgi:hypothetical protein